MSFPKFDVGLVLVYPHGSMAIDGRKTWVVKSKPIITHLHDRMLVLEEGHALGVIKLSYVGEFSRNEIRKHHEKHQILKEEFQKWWPNKNKFWVYKIHIIDRLERPVPVSYPKQAQVWVKSHQLKIGELEFQEKKFMSDLNFGSSEKEIQEAFRRWYYSGEGDLNKILAAAFATYDRMFQSRKVPSWSDEPSAILFLWWWSRYKNEIPDPSLVDIVEGEIRAIQSVVFSKVDADLSRLPDSTLRALLSVLSQYPKEEYSEILKERVKRALSDHIEFSQTLKPYLPVYSEKEKADRRVHVEEILSLYQDPALLYYNAVVLVGSLAEHGEGNDADIVVRSELPYELWRRIAFRLGRAAASIPDIPVHIMRDDGPFTSFVPLYHVALVPVDEQEVVFMKRKGLKLFQPIIPMKPIRIGPNIPSTPEGFFALVEEHGPEGNLEPKYDGIHAFIHSNGKTIRAWSDDGKEITDALAHLLNQLPKGEYILDSEVELWEGKEHKPREAVAGNIHAKRRTSYVINVFDLLYLDGEPLHKEGFRARRAELEKLFRGYQSTMDIPRKPINLGVSIEADSMKQVKKIFKEILKRDHKEGVVWKKADGPYYLNGKNPGVQIKYHRSIVFECMVLKRNETKTRGVYNYTVGVPADDLPVIYGMELDGNRYLVIGRTFSTNRRFQPGDAIKIEAEQVNLIITEKGIDLSAWAPKIVTGG